MRMGTERSEERRRKITRRSALASVGSGLLALGLGTVGTDGAAAQEQDQFPPRERTFWGAPQRLGEGSAAVFLTRGRSGAPRYLGVWFTASALDGLPTAEERRANATDLPLPRATADLTNVRWISVDWNPEGRPVAEFDAPNFGFRFSLLSRREALREIRSGECDRNGDGTPDTEVPCEVFERGTVSLSPRRRPPGYVPTDEVLPLVGNRWIRRDTPEFDGESRTHTLLYGAFDGAITAIEPVVALDYLETLRGREIADVAAPEAYDRYGFYPTQYVVRFLPEEDAYVVILRRYQIFEGS
jgi:hypothetical protein